MTFNQGVAGSRLVRPNFVIRTYKSCVPLTRTRGDSLTTLRQSHHTAGLAINSPSSRIIGYDFARALAVFGMVVINFKLLMIGSGVGDGPEWLAWLVELIEGRAAATFVILAGVGISLLSRRARLADDKAGIIKNRNTLLKRALFLFIVGLLLAISRPYNILPFYGVYITIAAFLLVVSERYLWKLAFTFMAVFVVLMLVFYDSHGWYFPAWSAHNEFWTSSGMVRNLFFNGFHPVFPWMFFILLGMWLGRQDMSDPTFRRRVMLVAMGVICLTEFTSWLLLHNLPGVWHGIPSRSLFGTQVVPSTPFYLLSGSGTALVVITLSNMLTGKFATSRWLEPFIATGQMTLTLYVAHFVIGAGFLLGRMGLLLYPSYRLLLVAVISAAIFCVSAVLFAFFWRKRFSRGPLELVMRRITG
jgi:uncharacterized protein